MTLSAPTASVPLAASAQRPRRRVIVHAGLPKTGTSSIQAMLLDRADAFSRIGTHVIARPDHMKPMRLAARRIQRGGLVAMQGFANFAVEARRLRQKVDAAGAGTTIISDENILGISSRLMFGQQFGYRSRALIKSLIWTFRAYDTHFVLYDRTPADLHRSALTQNWNKGRKVEANVWAERFPDINVPRRFLTAMKAAFPSHVTIVQMSDDLSDGAYLGQGLMQLAGAETLGRPDRVYHENKGTQSPVLETRRATPVKPPRNIHDWWAERTARRKDYAITPHRERAPIIVLGFNKTGTTSLHRWFKGSGIRSLHHGGHRRKNNIATRITQNVDRGRAALHGFDHFEAFSDLTYTDPTQTINGNAFFRELYQGYPDAYFILNFRPTEAWIKSRRGHGAGSLVARTQQIHGLASTEAIEDIWHDLHQTRLADIRAFFSDKAARFLDVEMNETASDRISAFLAPDYMLDPKGLQHHNRNTAISRAPASAKADAEEGDTHNG